ncbi:response regulator transcription factor [Rubellicoccus peritrichatus]|uniref:Response regulator transcription factor n=1 Tax=Rubellicoccus peritrichatus TaxID=3080537 RepID=A0AAQ3LBC9_9BACT|nr:response regulator transcription factor [Puniceicoccus sp. CR14]WOO42606.1 response regulator transcription factor [Puniceicoccus sp. CR14]
MIAPRMRILVVEDNPILRKQLIRSLKEKSYAVDSAEDGEESIYKAMNWPYDLIILDIMLPKIDGWEVLNKIRENQLSTPVLMLTARDKVADRVQGLNSGADDYLTKPFDMDELHARIGSLIRRSADKVSPRIAIGTIEIDTGAQRIFSDGEPVTMTKREYGIVQKLALGRGKVVGTKELLETILDENDDSMSNLLNVHLFNIRKKLGKDFIKTVRGQGYLIE